MSQAKDIVNEALSSAFFDVETRKCQVAGGKVIPGKKVIVRSDNGEPLAVVGEKYKVVTNEQVFTTFTDVLDRSGLNLEGAIVTPEFSHNGARTFAQIVLPEHQITVGDNDPTAMRLIARNSYDGSTSFIVQAGGYRFVCSNGQIMGDNISYFKSKHVESLDLNAAANQVARVIDSFENSKEFFESLRGKNVTDQQAYACLAFACKNREAMRKGFMAREDMSPAMGKLYDSWMEHKKAMGATAWALYNTMTHFSTHWGSEKGHKNHAAAKHFREESVRETLNSPVWMKVAA